MSERLTVMWLRQFRLLDSLVVVAALPLTALTTWKGSYPVIDFDLGYLALMFGWPLVAILWSVALLTDVDDGVARSAGLLLLVGSTAVLVPGTVMIVVVVIGPIGVVLGAALAAALFAVVVIRSGRRRIAWLIAPALVAVTLALLVSGLPRLARVAVAEPLLSEYADQLLRGDVPALRDWEDPVEVGSIPVYEARVSGGTVHLVTGYVGFLADVEAGLAYAPSGDPRYRYEHVFAEWYRWFPSWAD